jgi:tetrahydromethanopterin S-methyltransferase subunit A
VSKLYPWGGEYVVGNPESCVAAVTLSGEIALPKDLFAINGQMKTENLGVEKVVANVLSNPRIRFLIVAGSEVRGHRSGDTLLSLHRHGLGADNRVQGAKGAVPYIENISAEAVERFRKQVEIIDIIGVTDPAVIVAKARECAARDPGTFGEPYIAIQIISASKKHDVSGMLALHRAVKVDPYGEIAGMEG